jgi:hypothetical protein
MSINTMGISPSSQQQRQQQQDQSDERVDEDLQEEAVENTGEREMGNYNLI